MTYHRDEKEPSLAATPTYLIKRLSHYLLVDSTLPPPGKILSSGDQQSKYRKRSWFTGALGNILMAQSAGFIQDEAVNRMIETCKAKWTSAEFTKRDTLTSREDIIEGDILVQKVIRELVKCMKAAR